MPDDRARDDEQQNLPEVRTGAVDTPAGFGSAAAFRLLYRAGQMLASSALVPENYSGKPADCALIVDIAQRINASPLLLANNLDIIHGRPSFRSQFLIASVNRSGLFSALRYEWKGTQGRDDWGCRAWAIEKATGDRLDGPWIDIALAKAEGWYGRKGSKWQTMPQLMLTYRSAAFWSRIYAPDIALGFPTDDEVRDIIDVTPTRASSKSAADDPIAAVNNAVMESRKTPAQDATVVTIPGVEVTSGETKRDGPSITLPEVIDRLDRCAHRAGLDETIDFAEKALPNDDDKVQARQHYNNLLLTKFAPK